MTDVAVSQTNAGSGAGALERAAEELATMARELAPETEHARRLPGALVAQLRESGLLRAGAPAAVGAAQAPPAVTLSAAETIARGDASAGWCVAIGATSSLLGGWLPAEGLAEVLGDVNSVAAGVWAPRGAARRVEGGYRVSGRWPFCSGITHSDHLFGGCMLQPEGEGAPAPRVLAIPTADLEILDTWHTGGLNGTGSHDAVADDVFVPEHRSLSLMEPPTARGALYRFPIFGFFALSIAAAALGNARGAIDDLQELAVGKVGQGSTRTLAQRPATWAAVGEAEAALRAARALYYLAVDEAWTAAQGADAADAADAAREPASDSDSDSDSGPGSVSDSDSVSVELRLGLRLAATHAARTAADVARAMYDLGGGAAIYETSPLQRRFRDAHTVTAHFQVNAASWELAGRVLLGQPTETGML